jgi:arabinogalactan oligomer/maltooligosaccharide transport system permease protein
MQSITLEVLVRGLREVGSTLLFILGAIVVIELLLYFFWGPLGVVSRWLDQRLKFLPNPIRHAISIVLIVAVIIFAVGSISVGQNPAPWVAYWPLAVVAFLVGLFVSPAAPTLFSYQFRLSYMLLIPAIVGLLLLVIFPLLWEVNVSFTNLSPKHFQEPDFVGLQNYIDVFTKPVLKQVTFLPVFLRTVLWTGINVFFHVVGGMALALLLNRPMRGRAIYRMFLVLPWAIPQPIAALAWRGEFHYEYGFPNIMIRRLAELMPWLGLAAVQWKTNPVANFAAMTLTNIWLGIPFMMIIILGGLQSISPEYYEAAELDGASSTQRFRHVTLPLLRPVLTPAIILGTIWTFNNFNVPFFINENELETSDTLVTALFRSAFQYFNLGDAAAFAFVLFGILLIFSVVYIRATGGLRGAYE